MVSSDVSGRGQGESDLLGGCHQGPVGSEDGARAHIYIRFSPVLRGEFKPGSAKCVTVSSLNRLCLTSSLHAAGCLEIQYQPALGLAPRAIHRSLDPATGGLWSLPSLRPPVSPASPQSLETLQRPDPKTRASSLGTPQPCSMTRPVLGSLPSASLPLPVPQGMNEKEGKEESAGTF